MKFRLYIVALAIFAITLPANAQLLDAGASVNVQAPGVNVNANAKASVTPATGTNIKTNITGNSTSTKVKQDKNSTTSVSATTSTNSSGGSVVSVKARTVRGWSDDDKEKFMLTVKNHAQIQSGQDLENFATGILIKDENVASVESDDSTVEVRYKLPAKFLGIFSAEIEASTDVDVDATGELGNQKEVSVKFPWYRIFFSLDESARADVIKAAIQSSVDAEVTGDATVSAKAKTVQLVSSILKSIRAEIGAGAEVDTE
jgi:hypothetical protein